MVHMASCSDEDDKTVFMVHPIEGHVQHLQQLASLMNGVNIYGLQCTADVKFSTIQEIASYYIKVSQLLLSFICIVCDMYCVLYL